MIAYNPSWVTNLSVIKEAKRWRKQNFIQNEQFDAIVTAYPSGFYHPNVFIRILLFLATLVALGGVTGLLGLVFADAFNEAIEILCLFYGVASWIFLEIVFIRNGKHYKSGVNEAILYHSIGWTSGGIIALSDFNEHVVIITFLIVFSFAALRYADLICTTFAVGTFAYMIFNEFHSAGGIFEQIIPIIFLAIFTPLYFFIRSLRKNPRFELWEDCLILTESLTLITIYAAGNYFVVRELSENLMNMYVEPGTDIPFAGFFYALTVVIPVLYLYFGLTMKDVILLRVSLLVLAFSVFTFKYYFSLGHPEITLTIAGAILLAIAFFLFRFLRRPQYGYTRENLLTEKWADTNPEAILISQTMGGNKVSVDPPPEMGGGGRMSGGGSSDSF